MSAGITPIDLLLDSDEIVRVEVPDAHFDDFMETLQRTLRRREWLCVQTWEGCTAELFGHQLDRINMGRVVAML